MLRAKEGKSFYGEYQRREVKPMLNIPLDERDAVVAAIHDMSEQQRFFLLMLLVNGMEFHDSFDRARAADHLKKL